MPKTKTNPIGSGTVNLSINAPLDFRPVLGRLAVVLDESFSRLGKNWLVKGIAAELAEAEKHRAYLVEDLQLPLNSAPVHAQEERIAALASAVAELRAAQRRYYASALVLVFLIGLVASWSNHDELARRCNRCRRTQRFEEQVEVEETV